MEKSENAKQHSDAETLSDCVGKRIKTVRLEGGLSQAQLGEKLSVSQDTVSLWETGKSIPTAEYIVAVCRLFSVSSDYLLGLSEY
ncbi:MAG: helix-turn-helix transcriptional regulator [Clostridiales bacterium]|nr:helix-turn-helix transcriptional regulator [Clostridiales bacterium]